MKKTLIVLACVAALVAVPAVAGGFSAAKAPAMGALSILNLNADFNEDGVDYYGTFFRHVFAEGSLAEGESMVVDLWGLGTLTAEVIAVHSWGVEVCAGIESIFGDGDGCEIVPFGNYDVAWANDKGVIGNRAKSDVLIYFDNKNRWYLDYFGRSTIPDYEYSTSGRLRFDGEMIEEEMPGVFYLDIEVSGFGDYTKTLDGYLNFMEWGIEGSAMIYLPRGVFVAAYNLP